MNRHLTLNQAAFYSEDRIKGSEVTKENFVTIDCMLQNKGGITTTPVTSKGRLTAFTKGDILVGNIRPYLKKIWQADRNGGCSPDVLVLKAKPSIDPSFLYYSLLRDDFFNHMMKGSKGTKMPRGDKNQILCFHIPDIDFNCQQDIANVLASLDKKIAINSRICQELELIGKTLYDYWFVQFDFPAENGNPYKSSGGKMVWNDDLKREIPEEWEVKSLECYADVIDPHPSHRAPIEVKSGYPFAGIGDIDEFGNIDLVKARVIDEEFVLKQERDYQINDFSIGYGRVGTVGKVVRLRKQLFRYALSPTMAIINPKNSSLPAFVYFAVTNPTFLQWVIKYTSGSTRPAIGIQRLRTIPIVKPRVHSEYILQRFEEIVQSSFKEIDVLNKENQKLKELRDWLLPILMNRQVKVKYEK